MTARLLGIALLLALSMLLPASSGAAQAARAPQSPLHLALHLGDRGPAVNRVQRLFRAIGYPLGRERGTFGVRTQGAVRYFQRKHGLRASGVFDARTQVAVRTELRRVLASKISLSASDLRSPRPVPDSANGSGGFSADHWPELAALLTGLLLALLSLLPVLTRRPLRSHS